MRGCWGGEVNSGKEKHAIWSKQFVSCLSVRLSLISKLSCHHSPFYVFIIFSLYVLSCLYPFSRLSLRWLLRSLLYLLYSLYSLYTHSLSLSLYIPESLMMSLIFLTSFSMGLSTEFKTKAMHMHCVQFWQTHWPLRVSSLWCMKPWCGCDVIFDSFVTEFVSVAEACQKVLQKILVLKLRSSCIEQNNSLMARVRELSTMPMCNTNAKHGSRMFPIWCHAAVRVHRALSANGGPRACSCSRYSRHCKRSKHFVHH